MPAHPSNGTGFIGLSRYLDANSGTLQNETDALKQDAANKAQGAESAGDAAAADAQKQGQATGNFDYTQATGYGDALQKQQDAMGAINALKTGAGWANAAGAKYGGGYTAADQQFDSMLFGANPYTQQASQGLQSQYGGLGNYLQSHAQAGAAAGNAAWTAPKTDPGQGPFTGTANRGPPPASQPYDPTSQRTGGVWNADHTDPKMNKWDDAGVGDAPGRGPGRLRGGTASDPGQRTNNPWGSN